MNVQLFVPCFIDQLYPETAQNAVKLLEKLGCEVHYNPSITCCGQPAYNAGYISEASKVSKDCHRKLLSMDMPIVAIGGSCTGYMRNHLPGVIGEDISSTWSQPIYEITEFLVDVLKVEDLKCNFKGSVTLHDACGALRECGIKNQTRYLLSLVEGADLIEMGEAETCCGFGGTFAVKYEPISVAMAQTKADSSLDTAAEYLVSTDWSCLMHLKGYFENKKIPIKILHIIDLLAQ